MKNKVRKELLLKRKNLNDISSILIQDLLNSKLLDNCNLVGIYYPLEDEINLLKLLELKKIEYAFPKTIGNDILFYKENNLSNFKKGRFNVYEPISDNLVSKDEIDLFIIPCVGIDKSNRRIGYGKGYYDRYLNDYKKTKVALINKECVLDFDVCDDYDIKLDYIFKR